MSNDNKDTINKEPVNKEMANNKAIKFTAIAFIIVGIIVLIFIIVTHAKEANQHDSPTQQASSSGNSRTDTPINSSATQQEDPLADTYETIEDYQNLVIDLRGQIDKLTAERNTLREQVAIYEASSGSNESAVFVKIRNDLAHGLELYHNISCNGAYEMQVKRENYRAFIEDFLTENAYNDFFENGEVESIVNGTGQYASYEVTEETEYFISRRITAMDVLCTSADSAAGTANYVILYKVEEVLPFDQGTNEIWRINYGRCSYNAEKDRWQFDDIYMLKTFTSAPSNEDNLAASTGKQE